MLTLLPYQKRWLADDSRFKIGTWARQTGKTFACGMEAVRDCIRAETQGKKATWVILATSEDQAKESIETAVAPMVRAYYAAYATLKGQAEVRADEEAGYARHEVRFPGGSRITALPANPRTARGRSANVILDEFAHHQDSRAIWTALYPVISAPGLRLRVVSTPAGKSNKFYDLATASDNDWSRHRVDIYEAVKQGLTETWRSCSAGCATRRAWAQEYELKWLDEAHAWLPYELISSCEDPEAGVPSRYTGGSVYIGNDIAVRQNLWVAFVLEQKGGVLWTREIRTLRGKTFAEQDAVINDMVDRYNVARICIDQTGMGEPVVESAQSRYGKYLVEGVIFTITSKLALASRLRESFEDKALRIPRGDRDLREDLHSLKRVQSPTGAPRFVAENTDAGHADRAWALALALNAASTPYQPYAYHPVSSVWKDDSDSDWRQVRSTSGWRARPPSARSARGL